MNRNLDRAIDRCVVDMARAVRDGVRPELSDSFWEALRMMGAVHRDADGHEAAEKLKIEWLYEQVLARLIGSSEARAQQENAGAAASAALKEVFAAVMDDVARLSDKRG